MPDHDPGNTGGSVTIPSSPVPPSKTEHVCETCGQRFDIITDLQAHRSSHLGPHPVLVSQGKPVPSTWVVSDVSQLKALSVEHTAAIELARERVTMLTVGERLMAQNGRPPFDLVLIGRHGDITCTYRVQLLVFEADWLDSIEAAYLDELNREPLDGSCLNEFYQRRPWSDRPERAYAEALAAFRLAVWMRDDLIAGRGPGGGRPGTTYQHHLADARVTLGAVDRPLAHTAMAAGAFIENDFSQQPRHVIDTALRRAIALFRSMTHGVPLRWPAGGRPGSRLVTDAHTGGLLDVVEALAQDDTAAVDRMLAALAEKTRAVQDVLCAKKVAALAVYRSLDWADKTLLAGDPIFAGVLEEKQQ